MVSVPRSWKSLGPPWGRTQDKGGVLPGRSPSTHSPLPVQDVGGPALQGEA